MEPVYQSLVQALHLSDPHKDEVIYAPQFDHAAGDPVDAAIAVSSDISLVIVEGNYVAYSVAPWSQIADHVDDIWFVDVDTDVARRRIAQRHIQSGIEVTWENAIRRVESNDLPNGVDIRENLTKPDIVVQNVNDEGF